jgi:hypothetical protein
MRRRVGRPRLPAAKKKRFRVNVPLDRGEMLLAANAANAAGLALAIWCRRAILEAAR